MAALTFEEMKNVDQRSKDTVFGFIRQQNQLFDLQIPSIILFICLQFYYLKEYFIKIGDGMILNENKNIIILTEDNKKNKYSYYKRTVYGNISTSNSNSNHKIYKWHIKILQCKLNIYIGLDSSPQEHINTDFSNDSKNKYKFYALTTHGDLYWRRSSDNSGTNVYYKYENRIKTGDNVIIEYNTKTQSMIYYKNGQNLGVAYNDIDTDLQYYFAICLGSDGESVSLEHFEESNV